MDAVYVLMILAVAVALLIPLAGMVRALAEIFGVDTSRWHFGKRPSDYNDESDR